MKPSARIFVTGFEPFPHKPRPGVSVSKGAQVLLETARVRDACILLGKGRLYREFPAEWYWQFWLSVVNLHQGKTSEDKRREHKCAVYIYVFLLLVGLIINIIQ